MKMMRKKKETEETEEEEEEEEKVLLGPFCAQNGKAQSFCHSGDVLLRAELSRSRRPALLS